MRYTYLSVLASVAIASVAAPALAQSNNFSSPVTTGAQAPGTWYVDRHAPAGFQASGGKLIESISGADYQGAGSFYNTQGYKYDLDAGTTNLSIDLTVDQAWLDSGLQKRWAGLWGTAIDGDNNVSAYPIIDFTTVGGVAEFAAWDSNLGTWNALATGVTAGDYTLNISLSGGLFTYTVGAQSWSYDANGSTQISNVILQGYNSGTDYSIQWDNLNASAGQGPGGVPEPATWAMMVGGFGLIGGVMRRRFAKLDLA
jgi:polyisoprenoid-binding protein YceI